MESKNNVDPMKLENPLRTIAWLVLSLTVISALWVFMQGDPIHHFLHFMWAAIILLWGGMYAASLFILAKAQAERIKNKLPAKQFAASRLAQLASIVLLLGGLLMTIVVLTILFSCDGSEPFTLCYSLDLSFLGNAVMISTVLAFLSSLFSRAWARPVKN